MPNIGTLAVLMARGTMGLMPVDARAAAAAIGWKSVENMLQKAAIGEALTGFSTTSGTGTDLTGFVTSLRGLSLTAEVAARAQHWPINSRIGVLPESGYIAAEITEDSNVAPVFLSNGIVLIKPGKVSAIVAYSEELLNTNGAAAAIEDDLRKAISRGLDKALLSRIQPGSASGFSATSSAPADIKTLVGMISVTGAEPLVFGAAVDVNLAAATLYQDGEEIFEEVNLVGAGSFKGVVWVPVEVMDAGKLIVVDPSGMQCSIESVDIQIGRSAALVLADTVPNMPASLVSMFQSNSVAVRANCTFSMQILRERDVSAECTDIAWASS